jgi:hypothetical protein
MKFLGVSMTEREWLEHWAAELPSRDAQWTAELARICSETEEEED